jgi:hypothetical protein
MAARPNPRASDHWEAVRLAWTSTHIPLGAILFGALLLTGILSAVSEVWGYGP